MKLRAARLNDIENVLKLHAMYQIDSILEEDKKDGFVTTSFSPGQLQTLIEQESGLFIAEADGEVVAYAMAASWKFWAAQWPMFAHMAEGLGALTYLGRALSMDNSCQYGPVCIDKRLRGSGVLEAIFEFARVQMSERYGVFVTFINKKNPRSFAAHTRKAGLEVIHEFSFNGNEYYELACDTSRPIRPL